MTGPLRQRSATAPAPPNGPNGRGPGAGLRTSTLSTRSRPKGYAALAVALIVGLGALGYWFYTSAGHKVSVVVARHDIAVGHVITRGDLSTMDVAGKVTAVAADHLPSLLGEHAKVEILPNTLLQRAMVTTGSTLGPNQALVGVAVNPGQLPSSGLNPGDQVLVLQLPPKNAEPSPGPGTPSDAAKQAVLVPSASVYDVRANASSAGGTLLTLIVPSGAAFGVAQASSNGQVALVKLSG